VGWFDEKKIGTILPATPAEGAWKFVDDISRRVTTVPNHLDCKVYTYPTRGLPDEYEYPKQLHFSGFFHELDKAMCQDFSMDKSLTTSGSVACAALIIPSALEVSKRIFQGLEILLVRRLPVWKRGLDIIGAGLALIVFSPVMLAAAVAIKLTSQGPVIFKQERTGLSGKKFTFLKFRSMYVNNDPVTHEKYVEKFITGGKTGIVDKGLAENDGVYKIKDDPRVTPVGKFLRKSSLDELPQFINVLKGEMSLVGPRPPIPYEFEKYDTWHKRRVFSIKPGITGLWQVKGRSSTTFDEMVRLDLKYIREWSLRLDLKILIRTPWAVFSGKGAY
jgi:lipopolysaccharide/colanic/teichoic acid biosynthesis glycosyltransferase